MAITKEDTMKISRLVIQTVLLLGLWLDLGLQAQAQTGTVTYIYTDPQGTPLAEADATGTITAKFDYAPYGAASTASGMSGAPNGPGFTGHVSDPESGLVYMQARYYDPSLGRFLSTDPAQPSAGNSFKFNRYDYANNNPIANIDSNGRESSQLTFQGVSAIESDQKNIPPNVAKTALVLEASILVGPIAPSAVTVIKITASSNNSSTAADSTASSAPRPAENFTEPANPPQDPPTALPDGHTVRVMPNSTEQYPNGYWRQYDSNGNPVNPSTGRQPGSVPRAQSRADTHVPLPPPQPNTSSPPLVPPPPTPQPNN
jgi:RHS repeat-associated protein